MNRSSNEIHTTTECSSEGGLPIPITGSTRVYAIIGDPIAQAGSPRVFNTIFREHKIPAVLVPIHVNPSDLDAAIRGLRAFQNVDGIIVTVPHKTAVVPLLDAIGNSATRIGAVNAIRRNPDGSLFGENFDGKGCVIGLKQQGHQIAGCRTLITGAGGAGSAVAHAFADAGSGSLTICDIDTLRADRLVAKIQSIHPSMELSAGSPDPGGYDVVVNCTPVGMKQGDPYPMDPSRLNKETLVIDIILEPRISPFLKAAVDTGCRIQPGYRMLEGQANAITSFFGVNA